MNEDVAGAPNSVETPEEIERDKRGTVKRWLTEIDLARKVEEKWRESAYATEKLYNGETARRDSFNILWSNVQTLKPALYSNTPKPNVQRRYADSDPVGRQIAEVIERGLSYCMDAYDFDGAIDAAVIDGLVPGRGCNRVIYEPVFEQSENVVGEDDNGDPVFEQSERLLFESAKTPLVEWDKLIIQPATRWENVRWIAFEHRLTRAQATEKFGRIPKDMRFDLIHAGVEPGKRGSEENELFKQAVVYEIWDKDKRRIIFISPGFKRRPLKIEDDSLQLTGFFPIPRPLCMIKRTRSLVPVIEYDMYKNQAEELNRVTARINRLTEALKQRGIYDSTIKEMARLLSAGDNEMIPSTNIQAILDKGGIEKLFHIIPLDKVAQVLAGLYTQRDQIKQTIYEITGISDILRGSSKATETATAQNIKSQFGSLRLNERQREIQRYIRDLLRLKAEVIAMFEPQTLQLMTGVQILPEMLEVLQDDLLLSYRVDIETDSTIAGDQQAEQEAMTNLLTVLVQFWTGMAPMVQSGAVPLEAVKQMSMTIVRRMKLGRQFEDAIDQIGQPSVMPGQPMPAVGGPPQIPQPAAGIPPEALAAMQAQGAIQ